MTAPGAGDGISWVDVAASAAGIAEQMRLVGEQVAPALGQGINSKMPGIGQEAGKVVGEVLGAEIVTALTRSLGDMGKLIEQTVAAAGGTGSAATAAAAGVKIGESMGGGVATGFAQATSQLGATVGASGTRMGQAMGTGMAAGLNDAAPEIIAAGEAVSAKMAAASRAAAIKMSNDSTEAQRVAAVEQAAIADKKLAYDVASANASVEATKAAAARETAALAAEADKQAQNKASALDRAAQSAVTAENRIQGQLDTARANLEAKEIASADKRAAANEVAGQKGAAAALRSADAAAAAAEKAAAKVSELETRLAEQQIATATKVASAQAAASEAAGTAAAAAAAKSWESTAASAAKGAEEVAASAKKGADAQIATAEAASRRAIDLANATADAVNVANERAAAFSSQAAAKKAAVERDEAEKSAANLAAIAERNASKRIAEAERSAAGNLRAFQGLLPQLNQVFSKMGQSITAGINPGGDAMDKAVSALHEHLIPKWEGLVHEVNDLASQVANPHFVMTGEISERIASAVTNMRQTIKQGGKDIAAGFGEGVEGGMGPIGEKLLEVVASPLAKFMPMFENVGKGSGEIWRKAYAEEAAHLEDDMAPLPEKVMANFGSKMAVAGKAQGALMTAGWIGAAIEATNEVIKMSVEMIDAVEEKFSEFAKIGADAANTAMEMFGSLVEGEAPKVGEAFNIIGDAASTALKAPLDLWTGAIDSTVGHIPVIGTEFKFVGDQAQAALGSALAVFGELKDLSSEYVSILSEVGTKWTEAARGIAGQTIDDSGMERSLSVLRDITTSGALVHFQDVAESVGELSQRLTGLGEGAGLTQEQLKELTQTVAEGDEVLGNIKINIDNLTAAFNDFNIAPEKTTEELETLVNISRMTGASLNDMLTDIDQVGPSMQALGYDLDQTTFLMAKMNQELGDPAMNRMAFGIAQIQENLTKQGITDTKEGLVGIVDASKEFIKQGKDAEGVDFLKGFVGSARTAETIFAGIKKGIFDTPEQIQEALAGSADALHQPLDDVLEQTKSLEDAFEQIGSQLMGALAPVGLAVVGTLREVTDHISDWVKLNEATIIGWAGTIGEAILKAVGFLATGIGGMLQDFAPAVEGIKDFVVANMKLVVGAIEPLFKVMSLLPGSWGKVGTDAVNEIDKTLIPGLNRMRNYDLTPMLENWGSGLKDFGQKDIPELEKKFQGVIDKATDTSKIGRAFIQDFKTTDESGKTVDHHLDDAFENSKDGFKILGGPDTIAAVQKQLADLGITMKANADGMVTSVTAGTKAEADAFQAWWEETFGKERDPATGAPKDPLPGTTTDGKTPTEIPVVPNPLSSARGLPSEQDQPKPAPSTTPGPSGPPRPDDPQNYYKNMYPVGPPPMAPVDPNARPAVPPALLPPQPPGATYGPPSTLPPAPIPAPPASLDPLNPLNPTGGLGGMSGVRPSSYVTTRTAADIIAAAGVPSTLRGADGITIPTGFGITTADELDPADLMTRAGIKVQYQGNVINAATQGAIIPTSFNVTSGEALGSTDLMSKAGIAPTYQGDVADAGAQGVVLPTALNVKDNPDHKSVSEVMDAVGIPSDNQGTSGVTLDVSFTMPTSGPGSESAGFTSGMATAPGNVPYSGGGSLWDKFKQGPGARFAGDSSGGGGNYSGAGGGDIQQWLGAALQQAGLSGDESKGILAMNAVEGGAKDPKSLLGFMEGQSSAGGPATGREGHLNAFLSQWNDMSRRPEGGGIPGVGAGGNVTDWDAFMTWIREKIVGQVGASSGPDGMHQPAPQDYQNRLMSALQAVMGSGFQTGGAVGSGTGSGSTSGSWTDWLTNPTDKILRTLFGGNKSSGGPQRGPDGIPGYALGGEVSGPWTPGKDTVPMDLPAGSFVVNRAMSQQHRSLLDSLMKGKRSGSGGSGKIVPSILEPGERLVPPDIAGDNLGLLHAVNGGKLRGLAGGGQPDAEPGTTGLGDIQSWLKTQLQSNGLTADQARGILAMNVVEGGNSDPRSLLGFVESQARGPQAHVDAFMKQWNDPSRRPGGQIPGMSPTGSVTDWTKYMTWIREKIVGQTGVKSDFQGNAQPAANDYQNRLMQALGSTSPTSTVATVSPTQHFAGGGGVGGNFNPNMQIDTSNASVAPPFDPNRVGMRDIENMVNLSPNGPIEDATNGGMTKRRGYSGGGSAFYSGSGGKSSAGPTSINLSKHFASAFAHGGRVGFDTGGDVTDVSPGTRGAGARGAAIGQSGPKQDDNAAPNRAATGFGKSLSDAIGGIASAVTHPVDTLNNIASLLPTSMIPGAPGYQTPSQYGTNLKNVGKSLVHFDQFKSGDIAGAIGGLGGDAFTDLLGGPEKDALTFAGAGTDAAAKTMPSIGAPLKAGHQAAQRLSNTLGSTWMSHIHEWVAPLFQAGAAHAAEHGWEMPASKDYMAMIRELSGSLPREPAFDYSAGRKGEWEGTDAQKKAIFDHGREIMARIHHSDPSPVPMYRGMGVDDDAKFEPGAELNWPIGSWTPNAEGASQFARMWSNPHVFEVAPGMQGHSLGEGKDHLTDSDVKMGESIAGGRFVVKDVIPGRESGRDKDGNYQQSVPTRVILEHKGYQGLPATRSPWPGVDPNRSGYALGGLVGYAVGGAIPDDLVSAENGVASEAGKTPYVLGGNSAAGIDCSGLVQQVVENYLGRKGPGRMYTGNEAAWLSGLGFKTGVGPPGSLQVGFENYSDAGGHTSLRFPDGRNAEAHGAHPERGQPKAGVDYGANARSPLDPSFTNQMYLPGAGDARPGPHGPFATPSAFALGGHVEGNWVPGRDTVPMNLPAKSFVVNRAMSQQHQGLLDNIMKSGGRGSGGGKSIPSILEVGERLVPPNVAEENLALLHAINSGTVRKLQGGGSVEEAEAWAASLSGQPYNADSYLDCSGYTSSVWGVMTGVGPGRHWDTTRNFADFGFIRTDSVVPGAFNIAVNPKPGNSGHMIAILPNGVEIESGGKGIVYGSDTDFFGSQFSDHWYYPVQDDADGGGTQNEALGVDGVSMPAGFGVGGGGGGGGGMGIEDVGSGKGSKGSGGGSSGAPGMPTASAPTAPGSSYASVPPPQGMQPVDPSTPNAVQTPYGAFQYPWDMPPDQQAKLSPEQRGAFTTWLQKNEKLGESSEADQTAVNDAQTRADDPDLAANKKAADDAWKDQQARLDGQDQAATDLIKGSKEYLNAQKAAASADKAYADAQKAVITAKQRQHDNDVSSRAEAEKPPPWEKAQKGKSNTDGMASDLGGGIIKGMFQELGFPDVFGKPFTEWGIWKTLMGGLGFGASLFEAKAQAAGGAGGGPNVGGVNNLMSGLSSALGLPPVPGGGTGPLGLPGTPGAPAAPAAIPGQGTGPAPGPGAQTFPDHVDPGLTDPKAPAAPGGGTPSAGKPPKKEGGQGSEGKEGGQGGEGKGGPTNSPDDKIVPVPGAPAPGTDHPLPGKIGPQAPGGTIPASYTMPASGGGTASGTSGSLFDGVLQGLSGLTGMGGGPMARGMGLPAAATTGGGMATSPSVWTPGGAPAPAANTPAGIGSSTPTAATVSPIGSGTSVNNPLTVNNTYQGFNPTPQVKDQVAQIAATTSSPHMAGGGGILI